MAKLSEAEFEKIREQNFQLAKKACVYADVAYALAEAADSFIHDTNFLLGKIQVKVNGEEKHKLNIMKTQGRVFKQAISNFSQRLYKLDTDRALDDADELYDLIKLVIDRTGNDLSTFHAIKKMIHDSFESKLGYYTAKQ
jgi:hypothetical protein